MSRNKWQGRGVEEKGRGTGKKKEREREGEEMKRRKERNGSVNEYRVFPYDSKH